jgi:hypothetical protein
MVLKMNELRLPLKKVWFRMTRTGIKTEDYRSITPYWCNRFILVGGEIRSKKWWESRLDDDIFYTVNWICDNLYIGNFTFIQFTQNVMTLGYPKSTDTDRILKLEHKGIEIRTGNPEWGAEPGKLYFAILHGKIIKSYRELFTAEKERVELLKESGESL